MVIILSADRKVEAKANKNTDILEKIGGVYGAAPFTRAADSNRVYNSLYVYYISARTIEANVNWFWLYSYGGW